MDPEYQEKIEMLLEDIICFEASLIRLKNKKLQADKQYKAKKAHLEQVIKNMQRDIKILEKKGCARPITDKEVDDWIEEEVEKEHKRWEKLTLQERMKEHHERMDMLQTAEKNNWNCS